jgi:hypothetical protein
VVSLFGLRAVTELFRRPFEWRGELAPVSALSSQGFSYVALIYTAALIDAATREAEVPQKRAQVLI